MGGFGSGRYPRHGRKARCEDTCGLDVRKLAREGLCVPGETFSRVWRLNGERVLTRAFVTAEAGLQVVAPVEFLMFDRTPCHYGGERVWFRCPGCDFRRALLYSTAAGFRCSACAGLTHRTQQENRGNRLIVKAKRLYERIGGGGVLLGSLTGKPPGMHWRTFHRLETAAQAAAAAGLECWNNELEGLAGYLGRRSG